jgi:carbamoyl-phosphate synthase large subunit
MWFLKQYEELYLLEREISNYKIDTLPKELVLEAKQKGYGDRQIAHMLGCLESQVYKLRDEMNIKRVYKLVDTCAAEFKALTPYYYSTFEAEVETVSGERYVHNESIVTPKKKVVVLGSGPNRIGQGIEFDYSCVHGVLAAKECGYETIMINCNPETVSTDFDTADKLYFEPVFWEHIYDIIRHENPEGVIVQLGGQTALNLCLEADDKGIWKDFGVKLIGVDINAINITEDREKIKQLQKIKRNKDGNNICI